MNFKEPKICKCGHKKQQHQTGKQKFSTGNCQACPCSSYLNRKRPDKADKIFLVFGILFIGTFSITFLALNILSFDIWNTKIEMAYGTLLVLVDLIILVIMACVFAPIFIGDYFTAKKRKEFSIQEEGV